MLVLVSYDVNTQDAAGRRRLRRIARHCENWGQRVQFSVFECVVDPAQWVALRTNLLECMVRRVFASSISTSCRRWPQLYPWPGPSP